MSTEQADEQNNYSVTVTHAGVSLVERTLSCLALDCFCEQIEPKFDGTTEFFFSDKEYAAAFSTIVQLHPVKKGRSK
jgi:hypothetical protein